MDNEGEETYSYFWIERRDEETHLFNQFLSSLQKYHDYVLFHYGEYETRFLKRAASQKDEPLSKLAEQILEKLMNVLGVIYSDVYFPTFSNELKEIAGYLGFKWSEKEPSGLHRYCLEASMGNGQTSRSQRAIDQIQQGGLPSSEANR